MNHNTTDKKLLFEYEEPSLMELELCSTVLGAGESGKEINMNESTEEDDPLAQD